MDRFERDHSRSLETCVQRILSDAEFPSLSSQLQTLLSVDLHEKSSQMLADLVMEDYALTLKVLRVANSFQYNRSNRSIDSISRAIVVIGFQTVKTLAGTLLFFDRFQRRSPELKRLMLLSMLTAHHARAAADTLGIDKRDEAFLAGMFCNLGEVLVACYFPQKYAQISADVLSQTSASSRASQRVLGFHYQDLAQAIGRRWRMPAQVMTMWSPVGDRPPDPVSGLAQFGHDATTAMYRRWVGDREARLRQLVARHGLHLGLDADAIESIIEKAEEDTRPIFEAVHATLESVWSDSPATQTP